MKNKNSKKNSVGFTLIELLVAMLILAVLSIITTSALKEIILAKESQQKFNNNLSNLQFSYAILQQDLIRIISSPIIKKNKSIDFITNNQGQRVSYFIKNNSLVRSTWYTKVPENRVILSNINNFYISQSNDNSQVKINLETKDFGEITWIFNI